jgi:Domain of unknown function (DUF4160)
MPTVFEYKGFRFYFYSNEGVEPVHVHARSGQGKAKFWLNPVLLESSVGLSAGTLRELADMVEKNAELIERAWREHFS